jgi:pyruvate,orthophosphate dikinase
VVAGIRNTRKLQELEDFDPQSYRELSDVMDTLEKHYHDMCDIEFTIEKGKLWILQTRIGKRTAFAEWVMAFDMLNEGLIDEDSALLRVDANRLEELFKRRVKADGARPIAKGLNASPGAAVGEVVFTADDAEARAREGHKVVLVRRETTPDDYHGMIASQGILTSAGGTNSHAAVVARGEGIPAVCGADAIKLSSEDKSFTAGGVTVKEGDVITIDGFTGNVHVGELPLEESVLEKARAGDGEARTQKIWQAFESLMAHADRVRRLRVRANADTPEQARNARDRGAEGIGLCRTEHMFLGEERVEAVRTMIFADTEEEEAKAYDALAPLQREDFVGIFKAMDGLPVTVRLLDPPLHEFLPNQVDLAVEVALGEERGEDVDEQKAVLQKVNELHETNPMLGLRGVRLGIVKPGLYAMQVRAIFEAAAQVRRDGGDPKVEVMIPLVATAPELRQMREELEPVAAESLGDVELSHLEWGTMIELPRAAVTAAEIAETAEFFSFGTNDLTQTAFGFSRDDIGKFVGMYEERKLVPANPFVTIDVDGVGRLMRMAANEGRASNPELHVGICGEHGGDPASVVFCHEIGLDYVSCSPYRVETARLAAGQAVVGAAESASK